MALLQPITSIQYKVTSPRISYASISSVVADGQAVLDSTQVTSGRQGKLLGLLVSSSVPFKAELKTVTDNIPSSNKAVWVSGVERGWDWRPPSPDFVTVRSQTATGFTGFRVVVTNLDISEATNVYVTFFYDEE